MKLYLAHVGFYDPELGIYELHSNILTVAKSPLDAKEKIKSKKIYQDKKMHIDGLIEITQVDEYVIKPEKNKTLMENVTLSHDDVKQLV